MGKNHPIIGRYPRVNVNKTMWKTQGETGFPHRTVSLQEDKMAGVG